MMMLMTVKLTATSIMLMTIIMTTTTIMAMSTSTVNRYPLQHMYTPIPTHATSITIIATIMIMTITTIMATIIITERVFGDGSQRYFISMDTGISKQN